MEIDFYEQFREYSTIDLLKIIRNPGGYQDSALEAAALILKGRTISEEEEKTALDFLSAEKEHRQRKIDQTESYKAQALDFLEPIIQPSAEVSPGKWLNFFLVAVVLEYLRTLYYKIQNIIISYKFIYLKKNEGSEFQMHSGGTFMGVNLIFDALYILIVPVFFYLLYKRRRWGWILLLVDQITALILLFGMIVIYFDVMFLHTKLPASIIFWIVLRSFFIYFLLKKNMTAYFGVNTGTIRNTVAISFLLILGYFSLVKLFWIENF